MFLRHQPTFIRGCKEFEPIFEGAAYNKPYIEEYKNRELNRTNGINKVVYDCFETQSPYYLSAQEYLKPEDQVVIPVDKSEGPNYLRGSNSQQTGQYNRYYSKLNPYYKLADPSDDTLIFESRFESGNLRKAI